MCEFCREHRLQPDRIIHIQDILPEGKHLRSLEFLRRTGVKIFPGLEGITVRYNIYMERVLDKQKVAALIELPGIITARELNERNKQGTVPEMDQDHVLICWYPDWHPTTPYILQYMRWTDRGYKRLALVDEPEIS